MRMLMSVVARICRRLLRVPKDVMAVILFFALRPAMGVVEVNRRLLAWGLITRNAYYDKLTREVMRRVLKSDSVCVDVGCHAGKLLEMMMQFASEGKFYAFEPLPDVYKKLMRKYGKNSRIILSNIALSDLKEAHVDFNFVLSNPGYSGLRRRRYDRLNEIDTRITVSTDLLDNMIDTDDVVAMIKIDVEGAEMQVLEGGKSVISRDKPFVVFEHGLGAADCYGTTPEQVYDLLHQTCGLNISLLDAWLENSRQLTKTGFCDQFYNRENYYFLAHPRTNREI